jgi:hypothetical protein
MFVEISGEESKAARQLAKHFVGLVYYGRPRAVNGKNDEPWQQVCASCFVMSFQDHWFLVTAGHVLNDIIKERSDERLETSPGLELMDSFGPDATHEPFLFSVDLEAEALIIDDRELGIDLGMVYLSPMYRNLLEANGVVAVSESSWYGKDWTSHDFYMLVGVPRSLIRTEIELLRSEAKVTGYIALAWLRVNRLKRCPRGIKRAKLRRFFGRLPGKEPADIVGMSGCPILGFTRTGEGLKYWIVAIQSLWYRPTRSVAACLLQVFGPVAAVAVKEWFAQKTIGTGESDPAA